MAKKYCLPVGLVGTIYNAIDERIQDFQEQVDNDEQPRGAYDFAEMRLAIKNMKRFKQDLAASYDVC